MTQWAQLLERAPSPYLKHGYWYPVVEERVGGNFELEGESGRPVLIHRSHLRFSQEKPSTITRVMEEGQGEVIFYGICPEGHRVGRLRIEEERKFCEKCESSYQIDDEGVTNS